MKIFIKLYSGVFSVFFLFFSFLLMTSCLFWNPQREDQEPPWLPGMVDLSTKINLVFQRYENLQSIVSDFMTQKASDKPLQIAETVQTHKYHLFSYTIIIKIIYLQILGQDLNRFKNTCPHQLVLIIKFAA